MRLSKLEVTAECWMDLRRQVRLSGESIIEKAKFTVVEVAETVRRLCPGDHTRPKIPAYRMRTALSRSDKLTTYVLR